MKIQRNNILFIQSVTGGGWGQHDELTIITKDGTVLTCAGTAYAFHDANESVDFLETLEFEQEYQIDIADIQMDKTVQTTGLTSIVMDAPSQIWFRISADTNECECVGAYGGDLIAFNTFRLLKTNFDADIENIRHRISEQYQKQMQKNSFASAKNFAIGETSSEEFETNFNYISQGHPCLTSFHASKIDIDKFAKELLHDCE